MKTLNKSTDSRFKMSKVALTVSAVILGSVSAGQAFAAEDKETEVIEVVGIRGGVIAGLDLKRNAEMIVDAVSSEDMGKFPDANLAEALQRIPEVSIDRDGGEGRYVTIRGLGPEFNSVLLNGRKLASSEQTRAFSFDTISSDVVSEMLVYKTQNASLSEGGLGGTIDVRTRRPLDQDGFVVAGSLKSLYEDNADTLNPQGSFFISNTFMDGKVGALFGATYQSRESKTYKVNNSQIYTGAAFLSATPYQYWTATYYENINDANGDQLRTYVPIEINRSIVEEDRSRLGLNGALQFRPTDNLDITVDYLYSKFKADKTIHTKSNWIAGVDMPSDTAGSQTGPDGIDGGYYDSFTEIDENGVITQASRTSGWGGTTTAFNREDEYRDTETQMLGLNIDYLINDDTKLVLDAAWSKAVDDNKGRNTRRSLLTDSTLGMVFNLGNGVPHFNTELGTDPSTHNASNPDLEDILVFGRQWNKGNDIEAENFQISADLTFGQIEDWTIRTGVVFESSKKANTEYETPDDIQKLYQKGLPDAKGKPNKQALPFQDGMLDLFTNGVLAVDSANLGQDSSSDNDMLIIDVAALDMFINDPMNAQAYIPDWNALKENGDPTTNKVRYDALFANGGFGAIASGNAFEVKEEVTSFYIEANYEFMLGDMEGSLIGGLRYTHTEVEATGLSQKIIDIEPESCQSEQQTGCLNVIFANNTESLADLDNLAIETVSTSYDDVLPSLTLNLGLTDDIMLRLSSSQSMTRPYLEDMAPKFRPNDNLHANGRGAKANNADLTPYKSLNFDAALEWYFEEGSLVSVQAYQKTIDDYIVKRTLEDQVVDSISEDSAYRTFDVVQPYNAEEVTIQGVSFNLTQTFEQGFGYQFNYTWVDSDNNFDPDTHSDEKVTLPGLGDSLNLVGFYENGPLAARIAYNKRFEFLRDAQYPSDLYATVLDEPVFAADYDQVDARVSYEIMDGVAVFLEGTNLTDSTLSQHGRYENIFVSYEDFGRRYTLGVSGKF